MAKAFKRDYTLVLGDLEIKPPMDIAFKVTRSLKPEPNTATFKVWNLKEDSRLRLETPKKLTAKLEAGYSDSTGQLFLGEIRHGYSTTEGPDIVTECSTGDSEKEMAEARISASFGPKTPVETVLRAIARTLGVGMGNVEQAAAKLRFKGLANFFAYGGVINGHAASELTDFCRSAQLEWSIQDGKLQILDLGKALDGKAIELSSESGLIGSPTVDNKGLANATCLMIPDLRPGVKVSFKAKHLQGGYRVTHCEYIGETRGQNWYVKITAKKY